MAAGARQACFAGDGIGQAGGPYPGVRWVGFGLGPPWVLTGRGVHAARAGLTLRRDDGRRGTGLLTSR